MKTLIEQPDIFIFGLRLQEPVTTVSDLLIAAVCFYAIYVLRRSLKSSKLKTYITYYFLLMGLSTLWGGLLGHGFQYIFGFNARLPGWYLSMISIMLMERASIEHSRKVISDKFIKILLIVNIVELILMATLTTTTLNFFWVQAHSVYGVLGVTFGFHLFTYVKTKNEGSKLMLWGILILAIAAFIYNYPIVIDKWFNHLDFAHVLMVIGSWIFLKASLLLDVFKPEKRT